MKLEDYKKAKLDPMFLNFTVKICEDCYLSVCEGSASGGVILRTTSKNLDKNALKFSKRFNVFFKKLLIKNRVLCI